MSLTLGRLGEIKYTKLNKIGELTIYSPIES